MPAAVAALKPAAPPPSLSSGASSSGPNEEVRAFLQMRLRLFQAVCTAIMTFSVGSSWILWAFGLLPRSLAMSFPVKGALAALATMAVAGLWIGCRRRRPQRRTLQHIDALTLLLICYSFLFFSTVGDHPGEIAYFQILMVSYLVMARAIVVPSSPRRTLIITLAAAVPAALVTAYVRHVDRALDETFFQALLTSGRAMAITTFLAYLATKVIYGLRREVRRASRVGQYLLEEKIGEGGMGSVYRAKHAMLRRDTAVKLLLPGQLGEANLARFEREVTITARLTHPNTVAIFDYGRTPDGLFYYAMEYLDGLSLEELVELDGPQPPGRVIQLLRQACGALAEAHAVGLIHRDVKPANLLVSVRGGVPDHLKVVDFGLVKDVAVNRQDPALSRAGSLIGTPLYMAPEAITHPERIDARADLYALGAVAYYLLTGAPPFRGTSAFEVFGQHMHVPVDPPSRRIDAPIPPGLEALILKCLAKSPDDRPASALELEEALAACTGVPPWTTRDALRWWQDRGPALRGQATTRRGAGSLKGQRTVAINLDDRLAAETPAA